MKLKIDPKDFLYRKGQHASLDEIPTKIPDLYDSDKHYKSLLEDYMDEVVELQNIMYAHDRYALLLIFQGMDTSGKDGAIKHVMSGINPAGVQYHEFKKPNNSELEHDWMWRTTRFLPERGRIGIFNRSYYEEVLVVKVHPSIIRDVQRLPHEHMQDLDELWATRYTDIRNFERYLHRNGTQTIKFYFHLSKAEQRDRLLDRIDNPEKNWKMSVQDVKERGHWADYMQAYRDAMEHTHTDASPWYVVPADDKKNARLIVSQILLTHLQGLDLHYPEVSAAYRDELKQVRKLLESD